MGKTLSQILAEETRQTAWYGWMHEVQIAVGQTDIKKTATWKTLEQLARNEENMPRLVKLLKRHCPCPTCTNPEEAAYLVLVAYHNDNNSLEYVMDTLQAYISRSNREGLLFLCRLEETLNEHDAYPHLNYLYNQLTGYILRQHRNRLLPASQGAPALFTENDFRKLEKYLPHFREEGFTCLVLGQSEGVHTGKELAKRCHMSETVFRERFREAFGTTVSGWLHGRRKEAIRKMLETSAIPLIEIAEANGFKSLSTLSDYCRRNLGCAPLLYRKNYHKNTD